LSKPKILIVDDEQSFILALATFLIGHGYQVLTAYDATYAMRWANKEEVDLVVLDLGLPAGGGLFVLENLRRLPKTIALPVIISTADVTEGIKDKVMKMGASDFIPKPYNLEKLLEKIQRFVPAK